MKLWMLEFLAHWMKLALIPEACKDKTCGKCGLPARVPLDGLVVFAFCDESWLVRKGM